jgi:ribosomal-protein-alanine N-acetyltransferase
MSINLATLPEHYSDYFYSEVLQESPGTFIVADYSEKVIGYIMCRIEYGFSHLKRFGLARKGHVVSVAVLQEHRAKGVGRRLIEQAVLEMMKKSCKETYLEVRITNEQAISLYKKMGFKIAGTLETYYRDGEAAYLMAIELKEQGKTSLQP